MRNAQLTSAAELTAGCFIDLMAAYRDRENAQVLAGQFLPTLILLMFAFGRG